MTTKQRYISYFRVEWAVEPEISLEEALRRALGALPSPQETNLLIQNMRIELRHRESRDGPVKLHIVRYVEGEPASIVPRSRANVENADLDILRPDRRGNYLDGAAMIFVSGMHCLLMPSRFGHSIIWQYMRDLLTHARNNHGANIPAHIESFGPRTIANRNAIRQVLHEGIKEIDVNLWQYTSGIRREQYRGDRRGTFTENIQNGIQYGLESIGLAAPLRSKVEEASNFHSKLVFTRNLRGYGIESEEFTRLVDSINNDEDSDIVIKTKNGSVIKQGDIKLREKVSVFGSAKTISHIHAWDLMEDFFQKLIDDRMI